MDAKTAKEIRAAYWRMVDLVPQSKRYNFRAIWCDYRLRMYAEPDRAAFRLARLDVEVERLLAGSYTATLPPALYRRIDEDGRYEATSSYLNRCYQSAESKWMKE